MSVHIYKTETYPDTICSAFFLQAWILLWFTTLLNMILAVTPCFLHCFFHWFNLKLLILQSRDYLSVMCTPYTLLQWVLELCIIFTANTWKQNALNESLNFIKNGIVYNVKSFSNFSMDSCTSQNMLMNNKTCW